MIITTITMIKKMDWKDVDWDSLERAWVDVEFDWDVDLDFDWDVEFDWDIDFFCK